MKKIIIITAIAAAGAGAYFFNQQQNIRPAAYNVLDYVPSDTPLFSAQLQPFPIKDYLTATPNLSSAEDHATLQNMAVQGNPQAEFFLSIAKTYQAALKDADLFVKTFGLADNIRAYFYTLGALPVLKIEVENPQAIWDLLDKAEQESGYSHRTGKVQETEYRAYRLNPPTETQNIELIFSQEKGILTVTLDSFLNDETLLATSLGLVKAEKPISRTDMLKEIAGKHHFTDQNIAFLNHREIVKGLTSADGNQLSDHLSLMFPQKTAQNPLHSFRTAACQVELTAIADNWPRTVFGYNNLTITTNESTMDFSTVIESKNKIIISALQSLRGYIPSYAQDIKNNILALGFAVDANQLGSAAATILTELQTPDYQCQPLQGMQYSLQQGQNDLGMLGMAGSMANGLKGVSFAVMDYAVSKNGNNQSLESLDGLVSYSADNPMLLFSSLQMFSPALQRMQLPADGSAVDLSTRALLPYQLNIQPKIALKGKHLVIYNGKKAQQQANLLSDELLSQNGLFSLSFDFNRMLDPLIAAAELSGEPLPEEAMFLQNYNMRMKFDLDINENGIVFDSHASNKVNK
ncbi:hypothetical protein [Psychromonas sp.]|uniref:hypothetical protein n=1 Tax=Psychromonas sp. TaxID=1884585 RepID=UPI003568BFED